MLCNLHWYIRQKKKGGAKTQTDANERKRKPTEVTKSNGNERKHVELKYSKRKSEDVNECLMESSK